MKKYHKNPRKIEEQKFDDLRRWLDEFGDLSGIVHDLNSDEIIAGNQRSAVFNINNCEVVSLKQLDKPDKQGTIAHGYVVWNGAQYNYRQVRWTPEQCERANVIANKAGGDWDLDILLRDFELPVLAESGFSKSDLDNLAVESSEEDLTEDSTYTHKIEAPIYEITGENPEISELFDVSQFDKLSNEIENADIPEDIKGFLRMAATRHIVFNFSKIAEFYAHSSAHIQRLMENSALVIVDFERAIELGYVKLSEEVAAQFLEDHGDDN